jgi:DNA-binding beta-propeller fold protein YncE
VKTRLSIIAVLAALALAVGSASFASTGETTPAGVTETPLPINPTYEPYMAVDPVGQHVFVAASQGTSAVYVLDFNGNLVKTITGEPGASGMVVDTATHTLYVADYDATAIAEIDTQTLTETSRFSTAPYAGAYDLAIAGGKLWFTTASNGQGVTASATLDGSNITDAGFGGAMLLAASADGKFLAVGNHETEPSGFSVYDVSGSAPTLVSSSGANGCEFVQDITFDPSAANVLVACGFPYYVSALSTSNGLSSSTYPTGAYPTAVAVSADGKYVAAGRSGTSGADDLSVYPAGDTTPVESWDIGSNVIMAHSLAFSPDATRLFALSRAASGNLALEVIDDPTLIQTTTTLAPAEGAAVTYGHKVALTAHVTGATTGSVELDATAPGGTPAPVASAPIDGSGDAQFIVTPTEKTMYSAQLKKGSAYGASASANVLVFVDPLVSVTARTTAEPSTHAPATVSLTGRIKPARAREPLDFTIERQRKGKWKTVATVTAHIKASGKAVATYHTHRAGSYRVQAVFNGDPEYGTAYSPHWGKFTVR